MTDDERLSAIKRRLAAITPGPWRAQENHVFQRDGLFLWTLSFTIVKPVSLWDPPEAFEYTQYLPGLTTETLRVFVTTPDGVETDAVRDALDSYVAGRWNALRTEDTHVLGQAYSARYIVRRR